jgi:hypothetical protein
MTPQLSWPMWVVDLVQKLPQLILLGLQLSLLELLLNFPYVWESVSM